MADKVIVFQETMKVEVSGIIVMHQDWPDLRKPYWQFIKERMRYLDVVDGLYAVKVIHPKGYDITRYIVSKEADEILTALYPDCIEFPNTIGV